MNYAFKMMAVVLALALSSQVVAAVKWNNKKSATADSNGCLNEAKGATPTLKQLKTAWKGCFQRFGSQNGTYFIDSANKPRTLFTAAKRDEFVANQLDETGLVSYLLYSDGVILKDMSSPSSRLGSLINENAKFQSKSVGKSLISYLLGHAICKGYIKDLNQTLEDWPLVSGTMYGKQKLRDIINMNVGDHKFFKADDVLFMNATSVSSFDIKYWGEKLKGYELPQKRSFNYTQIHSNMTLNYIEFKSGKNFDSLLKEVYHGKVGIKKPLQMGYVSKFSNPASGMRTGQHWASRYDYLRIAIGMLEDWKSDNCVGQYLKSLYENRVKNLPLKKGETHQLWPSRDEFYQSYEYGGFFHMNMQGVKDIVFGAYGRGGQTIFINFDKSNIIVTQAVFDNFNERKLIIEPISKDWLENVTSIPKDSLVEIAEKKETIQDLKKGNTSKADRLKNCKKLRTYKEDFFGTEVTVCDD